MGCTKCNKNFFFTLDCLFSDPKKENNGQSSKTYLLRKTRNVRVDEGDELP